MECVAYLRVSTEKQAEEGHGLDSQKRDIENYAKKNEMIITDWYIDDGYTGANLNRPQIQRLISDCMDKKVKAVVAFKLDRISRNMVDGIYVIEKIFQPNGVIFKCVHDSVSYDSPMEQAYTQMMAVFAQLDKNTMMLRMRGGMLERVKKGYWKGGGVPPYSYAYDKASGILKIIPERAEKVRQALELYISGYSEQRITETLGFSSISVVVSNLKNITNAGYIVYKGNVYKGLHEPVFDIERYNLGMELRKARVNHKFVKNPNLLTGLCKCGVCGCAMRYQKWSGSRRVITCYSKSASSYYLPNYDKNCSNWNLDQEYVEKEVEKKILEMSLNLKNGKTVEKESVAELLKKRIDKENAKLKRLYNLYADGNDAVAEMIKEQEKVISDCQKRLDVERTEESKSPKKSVVFENIKKIADVWDNISIEDKNKILKSIISKVVIVNDDIEIVLNEF